jgi:hypothetical protein
METMHCQIYEAKMTEKEVVLTMLSVKKELINAIEIRIDSGFNDDYDDQYKYSYKDIKTAYFKVKSRNEFIATQKAPLFIWI